MEKSDYELCDEFGVAVYVVGDTFHTDDAGNPIPDADRAKWFVSTPADDERFPAAVVKGIPLSITKPQAEALAVQYLGLCELVKAKRGNDAK